MLVKNGPNMRDAALAVAIALPAAGATAVSPALDLGEKAGLVHRGELEITIPATPALADTKSYTFKVETSDDNATWIQMGGVHTVGPAAGGTGGALFERRIGIPSTARRYFRSSITVDAAGGNNTGVTATLAFIAGE
jgi:hypothetical protein